MIVNCRPYDLCVLPNDLLLVADLLNQKLYLYAKNFKLINIIDKINNDVIQPISVTTNSIDEIYLLDLYKDDSYRIYKFDFEFKQFTTLICNNGSGIVQLNGPRCIRSHKGYLYVCDTNNKRIQKYASNFQFKSTFTLNMTPIKMQIIDNTACVRDYNTICFYDLETFEIRYKHDRRGYGLIGQINSYFYEYYHKRMFCYDSDGSRLEEIAVGDFEGQLTDFGYYCGICYFSRKLILYHFDSVKLVLI